MSWLACAVATIRADLPLQPGASYFTDEFDATHVPWWPGPERNVEEVFKNFEYFEIVLGQDRGTISVMRHRIGHEPETKKFTLSPTGGLVPEIESPLGKTGKN